MRDESQMKKEAITGYRLSPQQERVWRLGQAEDGHLYVIQCAVLIEGRLNLSTLQEAFDQMIQEHELLRTSYRRLAGMSLPIQVVAESVGVEIAQLKLRTSGET